MRFIFQFSARSTRFSGALLAAGLGLVSAACGSDSGQSGDTAGGSVAEGKKLAETNICSSCHGQDYAGVATPYPGTMAYAPNLTNDMATGLGSWSDDLVVRAILEGKDDEDSDLCPTMQRYGKAGMTEAQAKDIVAFLRSLPVISRDIPETVSCTASP
jgi:mono/diheme cytochrome c family protein